MTDPAPDGLTWTEDEADGVRDDTAASRPDELAWSEAPAPAAGAVPRDLATPDRMWSNAPASQAGVNLAAAIRLAWHADPSSPEPPDPLPLRWEDDEGEPVSERAEPQLAWSEAEPDVAAHEVAEPDTAEPDVVEPDVAEPEVDDVQEVTEPHGAAETEPEPAMAEPGEQVVEEPPSPVEPQPELVSRGLVQPLRPARRPRNMPDTWSIPAEPKRR